MIQVYIVFFKIFVFLALGFVLNKTKVIDANAEKALSKILLTAVLPFMILNSSQHTYSNEAVNGMITCAAFGVAYYALTLIVMRLSLKKAKMHGLCEYGLCRIPSYGGTVRQLRTASRCGI